ncbi:MAG: SpoIIIAC/SpoIIIAD family protein [Acutalibacteraceae bacterium]
MNIFAVSAIAVTSAILCLSIKKQNGEISLLICVIASVMLLILVLTTATKVIDEVNAIFQSCDINTTYLSVLLKAFGICFLTEFTCDICKDAGETSLSGSVSLAGKVAVLIVSIPLFKEILNTSIGLMGG